MRVSFQLICLQFLIGVSCFFLPGSTDASKHDNVYVLKTPGDNKHSKMWLTTETSSVRFKFQACSDLKVALSKDPQVTDSNVYEIIVGGWTNSQSVIRRGLNGDTMTTVSTPGILNCTELKPFWIGWHNGNITVGRGNVTGEQSFMFYADPQPYQVIAVSLASGFDGAGNGTYHFYQDDARMAIATTPPIMSYETLWLLQTQKSYIKFGVKACNDAILALSANMTTNANTWEVVIGGYNNTQSDIRPGNLHAPSVSVATPGILSCNETRYFWVSYEGGFVEFGKGRELGQTRILSWKYENPHKVEAIGFSGWDKEDEWEFNHNEDDALLLRTQSDNAPDSNWMDIGGRSSFQFRLRAAMFAKVELRTSHENLTSEPDFKVVIGGQQRNRNPATNGTDPRETTYDIVEIIYLNQTRHPVYTIFEVDDLLNSDGYRRFWLSWKNQKLEIGRNDLYTETIGSVDDPVYGRFFRSLHLGTGDLQHHQDWEFTLNSFPVSAVKSSSASGDEFKANWMTLKDQRNVVFKIRACNDARILLASYAKVATVSFYEVVIGTNGNQASRIGKDGLSSGNVAEAKTPNILHCNYTQDFWISWHGTFVHVGSGTAVGESTFLQLEDANPYKIRSIAFDTTAPTVGLWEFGIVQGQSYFIKTPANGFAGHRLFRLATHKTAFFFQVIACQEAVVTFSNGTHYLAEVVMGTANNTKYQIKSLVGEPILVEKETSQILHCNVRRDFWLQWSYEWVRLGTGTLNENVIVEAFIPGLWVETLSIMTRGVPGTWTFDIQSGKYVETETPNIYAYNNTWMTLDDKKSTTFKVKACNDAHIALSRQLGLTSMHTYEIVIGSHGNTRSLIRNATQGTDWVNVDTPGILNCTHLQSFWIGWESGLIKVGRGEEFGINEFMNWQDPNPYSVHGLGISSGFGAEASWQFSNVPANTYIARTSSTLDYEGVQVIVDSKYLLEFRVQACSSAALALYADYQTRLLYEVGIGMERNTILMIYNAKTGAVERWIPYPDLLSCWQERAFWVSWKGGVIQIGKGLYPQSRIAEWVDSAYEPINSVTLFTWADTIESEGFWEISVPQVYQLNIHSGSAYNFNTLTVTTSNKPYFIFSVIACSDVIVSLSEILGMMNSRSYKVMFAVGFNQDQLEIHKDNVRKVHRHISCVVHCTQYREFWISWENGLIAVGHGGAVGAGTYLSWHDTHPHPISSVSVVSYSGTTDWQIRSFEGEMFLINTPHGSNDVHTWVVMQRFETTFTFDAMSCHEVSVVIAGELGVIHHKAYQFLFGAKENSRIEIGKASSAGFDLVHEAPTYSQLHCTAYQSFWISWKDGVFSAGSGIPKQYPLITWALNPEDMIPVQGITIGYKAPDPIAWKIRKDQTLQLVVSSLRDDSHLRNWMSVRMGPFLAFQVKACHNALIILSSHTHATNGTGVYYVELGVKADSYSYIREPATGSTLVAVHTPSLLHCNYYRSFWIGWFRNAIEVGYGYDIGHNVFMTWNSGQAHTIRTAGFSTFGGEAGTYRLPETQSNYDLIVSKSDDANFTRVAIKWSNREFFIFRVSACRGARVRLDGAGYIVEIGTDDNERTLIRNPQGEIVKSVETMKILSCNYLQLFWIAWANGRIELGDRHGSVIISWTDSAPAQVTGLSLATEQGTEGQWQTEQYPESELTVKTPDHWDRVHLWSTVVGRDFVTFQVAACNDAHLALSFIPTYPEMHTYQIIIGGWTNTKSAIRDEINSATETKVEVETLGILDCVEKRDFWAGWRNQTIRVGTGPIPFEYVFMEWTDPYFFQVEAVGMSTGHGATGEWTLKAKDQFSTPPPGVSPTTSPSPGPTPPPQDNSEDNTYTINTNSTDAVDQFVMTTDQKAILFTVNACRDVHLYLTHLPGVVDVEAYKIALGEDDNKKSRIYKSKPNEYTHTADTNIFTCSAKSLWVSWADGKIGVGEGKDVSQGELFSWTDSQPYHIHALAFGSKDVNMVTWTFLRESGRVLNASTLDQYSLSQIWFSTVSMDSAVVRVKTCHDAHILLSETNGMGSNTYEVAFGINNNTESVMREGSQGANIVWIDTPGILSCSELRYFWFRWKDQRLEVGTGSTVGKTPLMEHAKAGHPETILSVGVSTGWGATGRWEISNVQGETYTVYTYPSMDVNFPNWFYTMGKSFTFQLQECETAKIILAKTPLQTETPGYAIIIGDVSSITSLPDIVLTSIETPSILNCYALRTFWITWSDAIRVGKGRLNYNQIMEVMETIPPVVAAVSLQSLESSSGSHWQIAKSSVANTVFMTPSSSSTHYHNVWQSMPEQRSIVFKVRACADARVLLATYFEIIDYEVYEVWLGKNNNTMSMITDGIDGTIMDETSSHNILHCSSPRWFWIDWSNGIGIGKGSHVGDQLILNISPGTLPRPLRIDSVSLQTGPNQMGEWDFSSLPSHYFTVQTPGTSAHNHTWLIVHSVFIFFKLRACQEARILLAENPYNLNVYTKEVVIGGWNNTKSAILNYGANSTLVEKNTTGILQCQVLQDFWIAWNRLDGRIIVGKGELGSGEFLVHVDPDLRHIYGASVTTGKGHHGEWQFQTNIARVFQFNTTTTYAYDQYYLHLSNQNSSTFTVQACNDAHVGLFDYFLAEKAYEIVIGGSGNLKSFIRRTRLQDNQVVVDTPDILNCQQMLPFWVSWMQGHIKVGRGSIVDEQIFMEWLDPDPLSITFFSTSTGWGSNGLWQYTSIKESTVTVLTPDNVGRSSDWLIVKATRAFVNFAIHSCHSAHVFLASQSFAAPHYEVIIGSDSNTKSQIIRYVMNGTINEATVVSEEQTNGVLSCSEPRWFWLSWQNGKIEVAKHSSSGQRFLDWMDTEPRQVHSLSLATGPQSRGEWTYSAKEVPSFIHVTAEEEDQYGYFAQSLMGRSDVIFSVMACKDAHVMLSQIPGIYAYRAYEVIIGATENTETFLKKGEFGVLLGLAITPGILNCQELRYFWVSWTVDSISFGWGIVPAQNRILHHRESPGFSLNELTIRTPVGIRATWEFWAVSDDIYELHTPDDGANVAYSYNAITTWTETIWFGVLACNDAHIALQTVPGSKDDKLFEIVIGGYINSRSELRSGKSGPALAWHDEFGILNCFEYRPFWVRWHGGLLEVGKSYPGSHRFMHYQLTGSENVSLASVSFTTGWGSQGDWVFSASDVSSLRVTTKPEHNYNQMSKSILGQNSMVFRVQSCRDAHVALSEVFNNINTGTYEIVIGGNGNMNSFIRDKATMMEKMRVDTPNIMDCNNYKAFWVKWETSGRITVGNGSVIDTGTFMDWPDDLKRVFKGLTISTWDGATGLWDFSFLQGDTYSIFTENDYRYNYTWLWPANNFLSFKVKSCNDGHILLSNSVLETGSSSYEIVIGSYENTMSEIRRGSGGIPLVSMETPSIMNCDEYLPFWVRWQNKTLEVGSGPVDSHVMMRLDDSEMPTIQVASVTSWVTSRAEFQFMQGEVTSIRVNSTNRQSFWTLHQSTIEAQQIQFKVKSSNDAMVALLSVPSNLNAPSYEITIGANGNTQSILKSKSPIGDLIVPADTPGILDPVSFRPFWITWYNGTVIFGSGDVIGQNRHIIFVDPQPTHNKHVHSVAVASGAGSYGEWEFQGKGVPGSSTPPTPVPSVSGASTLLPSVSPSVPPPPASDDTFMVYTNAAFPPDHVVITTQRKYFVVNLDACKDAHVYLTHIPGVFNSSAYQISIGTNGNTKSSISKKLPNEFNQEFDTPNILPCTSSQPIWVKWDQGEIMVGTGSVVGQNTKLQWKDEQPYSINAFSLASKDDKPVNWTMLRDYGRLFNASTIKDYSYDQVWLSTYYVDSIVLHIMTCRDAHILLSEQFGTDSNSYEVAFGILDNAQSVIREGPYGPNVVSVDTPGIMSCNEFRYFWFRWKDLRLEVGTGLVVGANKLMEHAKTGHPERILSIGLSTGWEVTGRWEVSNIEGTSYTLHTDEISDPNQRLVWFYPDGQYFEFYLRTCEAAHIRLAEVPKRDTTNGFEIVLSNSESSITQLNQEGIAVSKSTTMLLDCTILRKFWVSWSQGVKVGKGKFNSDVLLDLQGAVPVSVTSVAVTTPTPSIGGGEWQVKKDSVKTLTFYTPALHEYKYAWQTAYETTAGSLEVRSCSDAYIILAKYFGITDSGVYEIRIGSQSNSRVEIRHGVGGTILAEKYIANQLHCTQSKWFWIDWSNGISVGSGPYRSDSSLLSISKSQMPEQFQVYAAAFATGGTNDGDWEFTKVQVEQITIHTPSQHTRNTAWLITQRKFITFKVRACSEARVLLAQDPFDLTVNAKEVVIGGWGNTKSVIYGDLTGNQTVVEKDTSNILNCDTGYKFWIEWSSSHIAVGKSELHTQEFLRYDTSGLHEIHAVSLSTGAGATGEWEFGSDVALLYQLHTTTNYDYTQHWYRMGGKTSVQFKVKACADAHVVLFDDYMADVAYEIVLGGSANTISAIRRTRLQDNKVQVSTPQILSCNQTLPFWVSWSFGIIKAGKGNLVDDNLIMQWEDPDPLAASIVAISTGWNSIGVWEFSSVEGGGLKVHMTPGHQTGHFVELKSTEQYFSFSARACEGAQIRISQTPRSAPVYEINLGIQNNTVSEILRYAGDVIEIVATENTPGLLDCSESRKFWVTWENGEVQVAIGSSTGRRFIGWKDEAPQLLHSVSLVSGPVSVVEWDYDFRAAQAVVHDSGGDSGDSYGRVMISVVGSTDTVLGVLACRDAGVAMSEITGVYRHLTYELIIGATNNTETVLRNSTGGPILKSLSTPQILDCNLLLYFWLMWSDGKISFGKGSVPGEGVMFTFVDPQWHPVNSLSLHAPTGVTATWVTSAFTDNVYELHTPDDGQNYQYKYNIITTRRHTFMFYVKACNDAHLLLQSVPGSVEDRCFEIVIGGWNNTKSVIRDKVQGIELSVSTQPLHLYCESYRPFWVTWRDNTVEVGRDYPYTRSFLFYQMTEPEKTPVNAVSFTTGWGSQGDWIFYETDVTSVRASTVQEYNYNQLSKSVTNQNSVVFRVRACRDAHLALSEVFNNIHTKTYELIFGGYGNMNTFIRDAGTGVEMLKVDTPNLMDCNNYKAFWAKWEPSGRITAGQGAVIGSQTILDWVDSEKRVFHGVTISTWNGASGYWDFTYLQGDVFTVFTESDYRYNYTWFWPINKYLTFKVKSCNDAHILLSNSVWETGNSSYEIVIGGYDNSKSDIRQGSQILLQVETPTIMNCHELIPFWIRWESNSLVVGSGALDSHILMRFDDSQMPDITVASVTSYVTASAEYQFLQTEVSSIKANSTTEQGFWTFHHSTTNALQVTFKVKSSHDAMLALLTVTNNLNAPHYELTIGANGNTMSKLKAKSVNGELTTQSDTPSVLDGNSFRPFWISWINGEVWFGAGDVVGQNRLLNFVDPSPAYRRDVHAVAVASGAGAVAEWEFQSQATGGSNASTTLPPPGSPPPSGSPPSSKDHFYVVKTNDATSPDRVVVTTQRGELAFNTDACKEAYIYLTHIPGVVDHNAYQISIGTSGNTKSSIRKTLPTEHLQEFDTPNILSCVDGQAFWVTWVNGAIMIGSGSHVGQGLIFHWNDTQPYKINAFKLNSNDDKAVKWSFQRGYSRIFNVSTTKDYSYDQAWLSTQYVDHVILSIMACRDAHILLSELEGMGNNTYEAAFGILDNTKSVIREEAYGANIVSADTPGILNCTEYRYFWIRWKDKRLEVGTGAVVGMNKIMEHSKPNHPERIASVGLSTGWEATGRWQVSNVEGISYSMFTNEITDVSDKRVWLYPVGQYIEFQLRTCENALIRLAEIPKKESTNGYDIALSNVKSSITKLSDLSQVTVDTPGLVHCTALRNFWITWSQGAIKFGTGMVNTGQLLSFNDTSPVPISVSAVITPAPSSGGGEWQILKDTVKSTVFYTPASYQYKNVWYTALDSKVLSFKVRACTDVYVALTKYFGITDYGVYEILIGAQSNSKVEIRHGVGGTLLAEKQTSNLLHCTESRWFWIDWSNGIYVGSGPHVSDSALLSVSSSQMPELFSIESVAFSTGSSSDGDWEFSEIPAEMFSINTPNQVSHGHTWLIMVRNYLLIHVRACSEVRLLLVYDPFDVTTKTKEVIIGGWSNTKSAIYGDTSSNETLVSQDTNAILNCDAFNDFWIQWSMSGISVGKGSLNTQEFLRYDDSSLHNINAVSISTGAGSTGEFQVAVQTALIYQLDTTNQYNYNSYWYRAGRKTFLLFKVKACNDAHVALFDEYMLEQAYEVVIGGSGNTLSSIRRTRLQDNKVSVTTEQILKCDQILPFWLSWKYGTIKVGQGNILDEKLFMQWQDPDPLAVTIISISTGWGSTGVWEFTSMAAGAVKVQTTPDHPHGHWIELKTSQQSYEFSVRSCQNARIFLSRVPFGTASYEIILGAGNNTLSEIHRYEGDLMHRMAQESTPSVIDCAESRRFWVSWANGEIELAYGSANGRRFLGWKDDAPQPVYALSFAVGQGDTADWDYSYMSALGIVHETGGQPSDNYGRFMISVVGYTEFVFAVAACNDASIAFSQVAGIYTHYTYELVIGATGNTETILRGSVNGGEVLKTVSTPQILNCTSGSIFWVSWKDGRISFGKGVTVEQGEVFTVTVPNMYMINSLSLLTPPDVKGYWGVPTYMGNVWELHTPDDGDNYKYVYNTFTTHGHTISFMVKECHDAFVMLQSVPGSTEDPCYEVLIGGWDNTQSVIRDGLEGTHLSTSTQPSLLHCDQYRAFWVSWQNGTIKVGKNNPNTEMFLAYQPPSPESIVVTAVSFTSGFGNEADWLIAESDVTSMRATTTPTHNYNQLSKSVFGQNSVVFRVQACRDAHIALSEMFNNVNTYTYEIIIGGNGNMNSFIRDRATMNEFQRMDTPNIMDCNNYKAFWVKWEIATNRITVGKGAVIGKYVFLDWVDPDKRTFQGFTISTYDNAPGLWDFSFLQGNIYSIFTEAEYKYEYGWFQPVTNYVTFKVRTCDNAHLMLSALMNDPVSNAYEIVLGGYTNTKSDIRKGTHGTVLLQVDTPNIMNCDEYLPFWAKWENKTLQIGSGNLDDHVIMRIDDSEMPTINAVSVSSWSSANAEYQIPETQVTLLKAYSQAKQGYRTMHRSLIDQTQLVFKVKAAHDAKVALLIVHGNVNTASYEVEIGAQSNSKCFLKVKMSIGDIVSEANTPSILNELELRPFWISWHNGTIRFGSGESVDQNQLLSLVDPQPAYRRHVHSVALATGEGPMGEWEFKGIMDDGNGGTSTTSAASLPPSSAQGSSPPSTATIPPTPSPSPSPIPSSQSSHSTVHSTHSSTAHHTTHTTLPSSTTHLFLSTLVQDTGGSSGPDPGAVAGIVLGCIAGILLIILIVMYVVRRYRKKQLEESQQINFDNPAYYGNVVELTPTSPRSSEDA